MWRQWIQSCYDNTYRCQANVISWEILKSQKQLQKCSFGSHGGSFLSLLCLQGTKYLFMCKSSVVNSERFLNYSVFCILARSNLLRDNIGFFHKLLDLLAATVGLWWSMQHIAQRVVFCNSESRMPFLLIQIKLYIVKHVTKHDTTRWDKVQISSGSHSSSTIWNGRNFNPPQVCLDGMVWLYDFIRVRKWVAHSRWQPFNPMWSWTLDHSLCLPYPAGETRLKLNTMVDEKCPSKSIQSLAEGSSENSSKSILLNHCVATQCPLQYRARRKRSSNFFLTSREKTGFWQRDSTKNMHQCQTPNLGWCYLTLMHLWQCFKNTV